MKVKISEKFQRLIYEKSAKEVVNNSPRGMTEKKKLERNLAKEASSKNTVVKKVEVAVSDEKVEDQKTPSRLLRILTKRSKATGSKEDALNLVS